MSNWRNTGITMMVLLIVILLVAITVASVMTDEATSASTDYDIDQMTDQIINEITSYLQIKDQKGKYVDINGEKRIQKIAILISPLVSQEVDLSQLTIQLDNGEIVRMLEYTNIADKINQQTLFEHNIWDILDGNTYTFITINDLDNSIVEYNILNENSDNAYLIFKLPSDMSLKKYDQLTVTLFPSSGITKIVNLKAPMPMKSVTTFE